MYTHEVDILFRIHYLISQDALLGDMLTVYLSNDENKQSSRSLVGSFRVASYPLTIVKNNNTVLFIFQQNGHNYKVDCWIQIQIQMSQLNPSWRTICALVNSMIGGTMLTLPILFRQSGLGVGVLILMISGWISYKTCALYVIHMSDKQTNIQQTIYRLLGKKYENFFRLITGVYLVFLNIIYVDLIVDQFFNILYFILHHTDHEDWITQKNERAIIFNKISIQIISLVFSIPLLLAMFIKNLGFLVRLTSIGVISVLTYTGFILFKFFSSIDHLPVKDATIFSWNFGNLAGTCAVAFTIHTVVNPIIKANKIQANNLRDLRISYVCGFFIYTAIGVLGSLPIINEECIVTIINCYLKQYSSVAVQTLYFLMLLTVFPCFINVGRTRLLTYLFGGVQQKHVKIFNFGFIFIATMFAFLSPFIRIDLMMNLVGAFLCFFFIYFIPIKFHWACLYKKYRIQQASIITSDNQASSKRSSINDDSLIAQQNSQTQVQIGQKVRCNHPSDYVDGASKQSRLVLYTIVMLVGITVGVYGIIDFFMQVINS